jgi:hypothetical protein
VTIWTDALCINQDDILERNVQVSLMSRIYREARTVLIWLGEAEGDSDLAFDCFNSIIVDRRGSSSHSKGISVADQPIRDFNFREMKAI